MTDQEATYKAEAEELRNQLNRFTEKVRRMRAWQKEYLKYFAKQDKAVMLKLQREVDNMMEEMVAQKMIDKVQLKIFS